MIAALSGASVASAGACQALLDFSPPSPPSRDAGADALASDAAVDAVLDADDDGGCVLRLQSFHDGPTLDPHWEFAGADASVTWAKDDAGGFMTLAATPEGRGFVLVADAPPAKVQSYSLAAAVRVSESPQRDVAVLGISAALKGSAVSTPISGLQVFKGRDQSSAFSGWVVPDGGSQPANALPGVWADGDWAVLELNVTRVGPGMFKSTLTVNDQRHTNTGPYFAAADEAGSGAFVVAFVGGSAPELEAQPPPVVSIREMAFGICVAP